MDGQDTAQWLCNGLYGTPREFIHQISTIDQRILGDYSSFDFATILDLAKEVLQNDYLVRNKKCVVKTLFANIE